MIKPTFHSGPRNLHRFAAISEIVSWVSLRFVRCPIPGNGNIWQHLATSGNNAWFIASQLVAPEVWQWIWTVQGILIIRRWACPSVCSRLWLLDFQLDLTPQLTYRWGWTSMNSRLIIWILLFGSRAIAIVPDCCILSFFNLQPVSGSALSMTRGGILGFHHQFATRGSFLRIGSQIPRFSQCICGSLVFISPILWHFGGGFTPIITEIMQFIPLKLNTSILSQICHYMGMGQYLLIPFLVGWTSIYQQFWVHQGYQGFDPSPHVLPQVANAGSLIGSEIKFGVAGASSSFFFRFLLKICCIKVLIRWL